MQLYSVAPQICGQTGKLRARQCSAADATEARQAEFGRRPRTGATYFRVGVATADALHRNGDLIVCTEDVQCSDADSRKDDLEKAAVRATSLSAL